MVDTHIVTHDHLMNIDEFAGIWAALEAGKNVDAVVISKVYPSRFPFGSSTGGGSAAVPDGWGGDLGH